MRLAVPLKRAHVKSAAKRGGDSSSSEAPGTGAMPGATSLLHRALANEERLRSHLHEAEPLLTPEDEGCMGGEGMGAIQRSKHSRAEVPNALQGKEEVQGGRQTGSWGSGHKLQVIIDRWRLPVRVAGEARGIPQKTCTYLKKDVPIPNKTRSNRMAVRM